MKWNSFWVWVRIAALYILSDSVASLLLGRSTCKSGERAHMYRQNNKYLALPFVQLAHQKPTLTTGLRREYSFEGFTTGKWREGRISCNSSRIPVKASFSFSDKHRKSDSTMVRTEGPPQRQQQNSPTSRHHCSDQVVHRNKNRYDALATESHFLRRAQQWDPLMGKLLRNKDGSLLTLSPPRRSTLIPESGVRENTVRFGSFNQPRSNVRRVTGRDFGNKSKARFSNDMLILPANGTIDTLELANTLNISYKKLRLYLIEDFGAYVDEHHHRIVDVEVVTAALSKLGIQYCMECPTSRSIVPGLRLNNASTVVSTDSVPVSKPLMNRQPVVAVLGHVDVGKTTLLSYIRKNHVKDYESGGITQSLNAFNVSMGTELSGGDTVRQFITFIDTPGHSAFGDMRLRGICAADIAVIVIAADDGIMDQTKECITACRRQGCPFIVAINKIDRVNDDKIDEIEQSLLELDVVLERFGGDIQSTKINARSGAGIQTLLELVSLQALIMELPHHRDSEPRGFVLESSIDKHLGVVATVLMRHGVLRVGDAVLTGSASGRVKRLYHTTMINTTSREIGPSAAAKLIGFSVLPEPGSEFTVYTDWKLVKSIAGARKRLQKDKMLMSRSLENSKSALEFVSSKVNDPTPTPTTTCSIPLVLKCDSLGSLEVARNCIAELNYTDSSTTVCKFDIVHSGVGAVTNSDTVLADAIKGVVVAFNVPVETRKTCTVDVLHYSVIYDLLESLSDLLGQKGERNADELITGKAIVLKVFSSSKTGTIIGCRVIEGVLTASFPIRIKRQNEYVVADASIDSLRNKQDRVESVGLGIECGINVVATGEQQLEDLVEGDIIECYSGT